MNKDAPPPTTPASFIDKHFRTILVSMLVVGGAASAFVWFWPRSPQAAAEAMTLPSYPVEQVALGRDIYQANCATCHGPQGEGNPTAGVPALNGSMHAWHHPDSQVAGFLRQGVGAMPPVGAEWSDEEIQAVLAYIKQWWEPDQLAWQTNASRQNP
jgi:mono/diheme cytochrome c family protein